MRALESHSQALPQEEAEADRRHVHEPLADEGADEEEEVGGREEGGQGQAQQDHESPAM